MLQRLILIYSHASVFSFSFSFSTGHQGFFHANFTPHGRGFDTSVGFLGGGEDHLSQCHGCDNSIPSPDWATEKFNCPAHYSPCGVICPLEGGVDMYCTEGPCNDPPLNTTANPYVYSAVVTRAVRDARDDPNHRPRFAFIAIHNVHQPVESPQEFVDLYPASDYNTSNHDRRIYNGMHSGVEFVVKNLTGELKAANLWNDSLLVFLSDNGGTFEHGLPVPGSSNFPLRGTKYTFFEGGARTAAFVSGGLVPMPRRGSTTNALISVADWYATFSVLAGLDPSDNCEGCVSIDGVDLWPLLSGANATEPRIELLIGVGGAACKGAYRNGSIKLIAAGGNTGKGYWTAQFPGSTALVNEGKLGTPTGPCGNGASGPCLFDLAVDPEERNNLAASQPALLAAMSERYVELCHIKYAPNGDEDVRSYLGLPQSPSDCSTDACWNQPGTLEAAAHAGSTCSITTIDGLEGDWRDGDDIFTFDISDHSDEVVMTIKSCGGCAFYNATGSVTVDGGTGAPSEMKLIALGKDGSKWSETGTFMDGNCKLQWGPTNASHGIHRWADFCKDGTSACAAPPPPPAPTPKNAACAKMLETGYWTPWVQ